MKKPVFSKNVIVPAIAVISGFVIRVLGYDWGRPAIYQPDEAKMVHPVLDMARNHSIISYNYLYPDQFMSKLQALALMIYDRISGIDSPYLLILIELSGFSLSLPKLWDFDKDGTGRTI